MIGEEARTRRIQPENIPEELKADASWVCWKYELTDKGKWTKNLRKTNRRQAATDAPSTWTTFNNAVKAYERDDYFDGIGFVFHDGNDIAGADFDNMTEDQARGWIDRFDSYSERSPSGDGFHVIVKAELPKGTKREAGELYSSGRFFTMTGNVVRDKPIAERQNTAEEFYRFLRRKDPDNNKAPFETSAISSATDDQVIQKLLHESSGKGQVLFNGDVSGYESHSNADQAFMNKLYFWTQDLDQIDAIWRRSGMCREKWEREDYRRRTYMKAANLVTDVYKWDKTELTVGGKKLSDEEEAARKAKRYIRSDLGNAERFVDRHGDHVRWCPARKAWFLYDGMRWARDERGHVVKLAHETARSIFKDASRETDEAQQKEIVKFAVASQNKNRIDGMLSQAKPYLAVGMDELDKDPWALNCKSGTLNLRTGELRAHDPEDLITRLAPVEYDPQAACPRFVRFLKETLVDEAVISFMKRYAGYSLTGITRERLFAILHGSGKNGKTTLVKILQDVMGDYATNTDTETILAKRHQGVGNDVAALKGARFVSAAEVEKGRRLAESKVKQLTGTDTVTARFLFGEPFDFRPAFKLWLSTNNKPVIQGTDDAIWDRIRLVPFKQRFEGSKADLKLSEKLTEELPGVLAWLAEGCLEWQAHGLGEPESVKAATEQYRSEMDTLAAFIEDRCIVRRDATAPATPLYQQYRIWCDSSGEHADTQKAFGMRLTERGFESGRSSSGVNKGRKIWHGIGLRLDTEPPDEGDDGSPGEPSSADRSPDESAVGMGDTAGSAPSSERSEPTNHKVPLDITRVSKEYGKRFTSFTSFTDEEKATGEEPETNSQNSQTRTGEDDSDYDRLVEERSRQAGENPLSTLIESRPDWLTKQAAACVRRGASSSLLKALAVAVAHQALNNPRRADEVLPFVRDNLKELSR